MKLGRRKFSGEFKAQVAIAALKESESLSDLAKRFDLLNIQIRFIIINSHCCKPLITFEKKEVR